MQWALLTSCVLILIGVFLRARVRLFQRLFIPAAVLGGLVGLVVLTGVRGLCPSEAGSAGGAAGGGGLPPSADSLPFICGVLGRFCERISLQLRGWPGELIAVVFAGLLLERPGRRLTESLRLAARQGIYVWIVVLGQVLLGLAATWYFILPHYALPASFGQLIETGFAGGHATAAAMGDVYQRVVGFSAGRDLSYFFATVGLFYGVASGIGFVNLAVRRGWTRAGDVEVPLLGGLEARHDPKPIGMARVRSEVVDPLAFQAAILGVAFLAGKLLQRTGEWTASGAAAALALDAGTAAELIRAVERMPLFVFTLLGGLLVREAMAALKLEDLIDGDSLRRITGVAMEVVIVSAIASMELSAIVALAAPVFLLIAIGCIWTGICLLLLARWLLPRDHWFELGILNYGMSTATTAQGLMLLRIVDKDLTSGAAEDYALAAPLSAPFIGGGIVTLSLPALLENVNPPWIMFVLFLLIFALTGLAIWLARSDAGTN